VGLCPDEINEFFNLPNLSSRTIVLGFTEFIRELCAGGGGLSAAGA
jgi:hypothetical protein